MGFIKSGKVKKIYDAGNNELEFVFTDNISVFDCIIPSMIPRKGETLCRTTAFWFEELKKNNIKNHFIELTAPDKMRVRKVDVIRDYDKINEKTLNYLIPLEVIARYYVAGSLYRKVKAGKISASWLGFEEDHKVKYGDRLPVPFIECTTKLEEYDRELSDEEAIKMAGLSKEEFKNIKSTIIKIDEIIAKTIEKNNLIHVDGKKEFAFDENRNLIVIDGFGTADEDRFWDMAEYEKGNIVELSKEFVRQHYIDIGFKEKLDKAREAGEEIPKIPPLPDDLIEKTSRLYIDMYEKLTGEVF
ncbi:MAG: phosphoribosylaminoimidazolesuccinocarboxamide synthase [Candidatus Nanohalarchaeota archaeon]|nr:MAG: phosphoribosylaminoimidazolesuccinocarboxamide synthase [Candidatus Nanohaloarchaeota archaeon]